MRQDGHPDCATVIKTLQEKPDLGPKLKAAIDLDLGPKPKADHVKTLSLILCKEFSVEQYEEWRKNVNSTVGYSVYPCYKTLAKSKELLHPAVIITKVERFLIQEQIWNWFVLECDIYFVNMATHFCFYFQTLIQNPGSLIYPFGEVFLHTLKRLLQIPRIKRRFEQISKEIPDGQSVLFDFLIKWGFDVSTP